jgi:DNA (cytosine-5)-methyltransferase 1
MRAIDLYAGVGGWSLGLELAGVEVVAAYEWWPPAADTYRHNLGGVVRCTDIRSLDLSLLPSNVDLIVGSPPCTEFSFSNRGGSGDFCEGIKDLVRFFEIVRHVRPTHWVLENVPRVAKIVREGFAASGHPLYRFRALKPDIAVVDFAELGLPQARKRCLIGSFPIDKVRTLGAQQRTRTLSDVVSSLGSSKKVRDPIWNIELERGRLTEMEMEEPLAREQLRMNRDAKRFHPVYNDMAFPDRLNAPSRTVTATCSRVSRESIVIRDTVGRGLRRLTVRERASLQGFPITYQFFGNSHSQKIKLVGNAFPPPVAYLIGRAVCGAVVARGFESVGKTQRLPKKQPPQTRPERRAVFFSWQRRFHVALPHLRMKSGVRFDLANEVSTRRVHWKIRFHYGPSKEVQRITPSAATLDTLRASPLVKRALKDARPCLMQVHQLLAMRTPSDLQHIWTGRKSGKGPYDLVDLLGAAALRLKRSLGKSSEACVEAERLVLTILATGGSRSKFARSRKVADNATAILAGLILSSWFNALDWHRSERRV